MPDRCSCCRQRSCLPCSTLSLNCWDLNTGSGISVFTGSSAGVLVLLLVFGRHKNPYRGWNIPLLIVRGCTGRSVAFVCVISAIRLLPVSTALVIFYSFPAFAALTAFLLYRETIGIRQLACIAGRPHRRRCFVRFSAQRSIAGPDHRPGGRCFRRHHRNVDPVAEEKKTVPWSSISIFAPWGR